MQFFMQRKCGRISLKMIALFCHTRVYVEQDASQQRLERGTMYREKRGAAHKKPIERNKHAAAGKINSTKKALQNYYRAFELIKETYPK
jgi:hypothetical protein